MAYTTVDNPELYFQTKLYTGDGGSSKAITLDGDENMQPDWVWIKSRSTSDYDNMVTDSVRGTQKTLKTNLTGAEDSNPGAGGIGSFDSDGFTIAEGSINNTNMNNSGTTYVAWNWKAGTSFTNDASATSVGTIDSAGSSNSTSGFSIVTYTGTGQAGTIAHNLGSAPTTIFIKVRSHSDSWTVGHNSKGWGGFVRLDTTQAFGSNTNTWNNTAPTSTVFSLDHDDVNASSRTYVAYCFAEKQGYSKFGSYVGNANTNGPFVYTGFRPAFVMVKATDATKSWYILDNKRSTSGSNVVDDQLLADTSDSEFDGSNIDMLSNGFKFRGSGSGEQGDGTNYIFWAFAEAPFVNSNGVPGNAR